MSMGDTESVIAASLATARESGALSDAPDVSIDVSDDGGDDGLNTESGTEDTGETAAPSQAAKSGSKPIAAAEEEEELDGTDETALRKAAGQDHRVPWKRIPKISANREKKALLAVAEAFGVKLDPKTYRRESFDSALANIIKEYNELRAESADFRDVLPVIMNHPDKYISEILPKFNPAYANYTLREMKEAAKEEQERTGPDPNDPEPQPTYDIGNGLKTYTMEEHAKLREWDRRQGKREAVAEAKKITKQMLDERFTDIDRERDERKKTMEEHESLEKYMNFELKRAQRRRGFKEHEDEIREAVVKGKFKDMVFGDALDAAYDEIVLGKFITDHDAAYAAAMERLKKQGKGTSVGSTIADKVDTEKKEDNEAKGSDRTESVIRKRLARARREGAIK